MTEPDAVFGSEPNLDEELGVPIRELQELEEPVSAVFLGRVLSSLRRRSLASQVATFSWLALGLAILEFLRIAFSFFDSTDSTKEEGGSD